MLGWIRKLALVAILGAAAIYTMRFLYPLPERDFTDASPMPSPSALAETLRPAIESHPGLSGILPLPGGVDAFVARILLARAAESTIDAQYYIWQDDLTGIRLLSELQGAAKRGVYVRLLVDDNGTPALDQELAALDALDTAEVRFFNPFTLRDHRIVNYAFDFLRLNRRMHNKSFTVDRVATIVGGRNIGDVYFETGDGHVYLDLDVLALGPAANEVTADFERYWTSASSYPALSLIDLAPDAAERLDGRDAEMRESPQGVAYHRAAQASTLIEELRTVSLPIEWVPARLFSDDPAKALGEADEDSLLIRQLMAEIGTAETSFDLISAYFIPGDTATDRFAEMAEDGVRVRILTNSLEATDVLPVHAGYAPYRENLVAGGVELWELRSASGERRTVNELGISDFSDSALHAKSFAIDGTRAFVGSMNFDPRSKRLNTEMGLLIDSPRAAAAIGGWLDQNLGKLAYRVGADEGRLVWTGEDGSGGMIRFDEEPNTSLPLRLLVGAFGLLPIRWML